MRLRHRVLAVLTGATLCVPATATGQAKVFLNPSDQSGNPVSGGGSEADYALLIAESAREILEVAGFQVRVDQNRVNAPRNANSWGADVFVSIHSNGGRAPNQGHGTETLYRATASPSLALAVQGALIAQFGDMQFGDRGVVPRSGNSSVYVLDTASMPASLAESVFHDCTTAHADGVTESEFLRSAEGQSLIAQAIANGVCQNLTGTVCPGGFEIVRVAGTSPLYAVEDGIAHRIFDLDSYLALGAPPIRDVEATWIEGLEAGRSLDGSDQPLLRDPSAPHYYVLANGQLRRFEDEASYSCYSALEFRDAFEHATPALLARWGLGANVTTSDCGGPSCASVGTFPGDETRIPETDAFVNAFDRWQGPLGCPADNGGGTFVHDVYGVLLQDYLQTDPSRRFEGSDGWSALAYNGASGTTFLIRSGFWGVFKCLSADGHSIGGAVLLGAPHDEEHAEGGVVRQAFDRGYLWWDGSQIHVHLDEHNAGVDFRTTTECVQTPVVENPPEPSLCSCGDADNDGYYSVSCLDVDCAPSTDCRDDATTIHPGAAEICEDGIDQDCDGVDAACQCPDSDRDGYTSAACGGTDCNDSSAAISPGAVEACNGIDDDCDGSRDEGLSIDADGDGHFVLGSCAGPADDCDDANPTIYRGAGERCDGLDNDCDGVVPLLERDTDADGLRGCEGDCDDASPTVRPGAVEICGDGVDQDCLGGDLACACPDADGDSFTSSSCGGVDCDDADPGVSPAAAEVCGDGVDQNCDGTDAPCLDVDGDGVPDVDDQFTVLGHTLCFGTAITSDRAGWMAGQAFFVGYGFGDVGLCGQGPPCSGWCELDNPAYSGAYGWCYDFPTNGLAYRVTVIDGGPGPYGAGQCPATTAFNWGGVDTYCFSHRSDPLCHYTTEYWQACFTSGASGLIASMCPDVADAPPP